MSKFLSCDWGTSSLRLRLVDAGTREICAEYRSDTGIAETWRAWLEYAKPQAERIHFYQSRLAEAIAQLPVATDAALPVLLSGMASSSIGLAELPYQPFPFRWDMKQLLVNRITGGEKFTHPLYLVSGFKTDEDVMRGEETMLLGMDVPDDDEQIIIFPGTHSKHVFVKKKTGIDFRSYMTGELFNWLAGQSILKSAVAKGEDKKSFAEGFMAAEDGNLLHELFTIRSRHLLQQTDPVGNYQWLSGLLIGTELKDLETMDCPVTVVCSEHLKDAYMLGLELQNKDRKTGYWPDELMLIKGHCKMAVHYF